MKKIIFLTFLLAGCYIMQAQTAEQAQKKLYYERYNSAHKEFSDYLKANPTDARAWYGLTRTTLLQNKVMVAGQGLQAAPAAIHNEPLFQVAMGSIMLRLDKGDSAGYYFNEALDKTRNRDPEVLAAVAQAHIDSEKGNAQYAIELLEKAIKRDKKNPALYTLMGDAYMKLNNGSEAFTSYQKAIELNSGFAPAYYKMGEIFLGQKNPEMYLEYFNKAVAADASYSPAYYKLYTHYFFHDPAKALQYYQQYSSNSDPGIKQDYELADLYYLTRQYDKAVAKADEIINKEGNKVQPRLYKLLGYSQAGLGDSAKAITYMQQYFVQEADSNVIARDFETMAELYNAAEQDSLAVLYLVKATEKEKDAAKLTAYYKKLGDYAKENRDYAAQAEWLQKYYQNNASATNVDLFNWALAHYRAEEYALADSVFGIYTEKYPEQSFGYYWRARSNVARDTDIENGLAVPNYRKFIELLSNDTTNDSYKKWMVEAYAYLAAYEANAEKDFAEAVNYFEKVLEVDPQNEDAKKYIAILEKNINESGK